MKRFFPPLVALALVILTVGSGALHGLTSNRWGTPPVMAQAAKQLDQLPAQVGGWRFQEIMPVSDNALNQLQCAGHLGAVYRHDVSGEIVQVAVLLGPPGPISVHTPEICYSGRNYKINQAPQKVSLESRDGRRHTMWAMGFQSRKLSGETLRVYYGWSTGNTWVASNEPRLEFARSPYLYKIQLAGTPLSGDDIQRDDLCRRFLQEFLPVLHDQLRRSES
jgi:hypothetical protein